MLAISMKVYRTMLLKDSYGPQESDLNALYSANVYCIKSLMIGGVKLTPPYPLLRLSSNTLQEKPMAVG